MKSILEYLKSIETKSLAYVSFLIVALAVFISSLEQSSIKEFSLYNIAMLIGVALCTHFIFSHVKKLLRKIKELEESNKD